MEVQLYIYDLSQGMARQYSRALTGVQIDAIYHTAVVLGGVEYFFGQGVHRKVPGTTHHGRPMKVINMGRTELPPELIEDYVQSLESIYTPESYDLFLHNCNNFSQDLCMFLVGKSIPKEISSLPETFLKTPIGQMLRGQLDRSMRQMTQAPDAVAGRNAQRPHPTTTVPTTNGVSRPSTNVQIATFANAKTPTRPPGRVHYPKNTTELDQLLKKAFSSCSVIFFTSATCPPCRVLYPVYDELAEEAGPAATLIKVDVSQCYDIAAQYQIRVTPTFVTFLKGRKEEEWAGADEARLRGTIRLLIQTANPRHAHTCLNLPSFRDKIEKPIIYTKVPPLDKLLAKIGPAAKDRPIENLVSYIKAREHNGLEEAPLPDMAQFSSWATTRFALLPTEIHFAIIDLVRVSAVDPRVSSYLAAETDLRTLQTLIPEATSFSQAPYALSSVTLQLLCNLFSSSVFQDLLHSHSSGHNLLPLFDRVISQSLLNSHSNTRTLAAALLYNLTAFTHNQHIDTPSRISDSNFDPTTQIPETEAALVQALTDQVSDKTTLHSLLLALGMMLYCLPLKPLASNSNESISESSLLDLCTAMDLRQTLKEKRKLAAFRDEPLLREIEELLGKGFN